MLDSRSPAQPNVRPLRREDARGVATLVAAYFAEIGTVTAMSVEQTEQLFATPWLKEGTGLVLECGSEMAGHGFVRPTRWKGIDSIQLGLTLKQGFRDREIYHVLVDQLLEAASELARKHGIGNISVNLRSTDTIHAPIILDLGFQEHPILMLGLRHDLDGIPSRPLPQGLSFRPARLPAESSTVLSLMDTAFDDRDRQGEPMSDTYLDFIAGKSGFEPEQVLLVENSGDAVGCAILDANVHGAGSNYCIMELGVLPDSRHRGIGSAMICRALEWLKARGARAALTGMFSSNVAATLFWRLGFRPDPQRTFRFFVREVTAPSAHGQTGVPESNN